MGMFLALLCVCSQVGGGRRGVSQVRYSMFKTEYGNGSGRPWHTHDLSKNSPTLYPPTYHLPMPPPPPRFSPTLATHSCTSTFIACRFFSPLHPSIHPPHTHTHTHIHTHTDTHTHTLSLFPFHHQYLSNFPSSFNL